MDSPQMQDAGSGPVALVLHGGAGTGSVVPIADHLSQHMRVLRPTHPGWDATPRPPELRTIADLASLYAGILAAQELRDVTVIGSSAGGWIGMEMAATDAESRIGRLVLVDAVGAGVDGQTVTDVSALAPSELSALSFHDPERFAPDPASLTPEQVQTQRDNIAALVSYAGGPGMDDPNLVARLGDIGVPTLALWGESDGVATPDYGRALAGAIPGARFELIDKAGHLPQVERPGETFRAIDAFLIESEPEGERGD